MLAGTALFSATPDVNTHIQNTTDIAPQKEKRLFTPPVTVIDTKSSTTSDDELALRQQITAEFGENFYEFLNNYLSHGEKVTQTMEGTWEKLGLQSSGVELTPLQGIFDQSHIKFIEDSLGNRGISINFDPDKVIDLLKNDKSKVVNMSFQVGDVELYLEKKRKEVPEPKIPVPHFEQDKNNEEINPERIYLFPPEGAYYVLKDDVNVPTPMGPNNQPLTPITPEEYQELVQKIKKDAEENAKIVEVENPGIKIVGAYDRQKASENLKKLFEVARAYPDKLFFAAGGNEGEDLRETLQAIGDDKPNNILLVAQWGVDFAGQPSVKPTENVYGDDIYVTNESLGVKDGSSFSVPVLVAYASVLFESGYTQEEIKQIILNATRIITYEVDNEKEKAKVFDPQLIIFNGK